MAKIDEKDKETIRSMFSDRMSGPVHIRFFGSKENCDYCDDTLEILEELKSLTEHIDLQVFDKDEHPDEVSRLAVDKFPAIVFVKEDETDTGIRFYGIPAGYEFSTLIEDIIDVANDDIGLEASTIEALKEIKEDITLSVFVTPT